MSGGPVRYARYAAGTKLRRRWVYHKLRAVTRDGNATFDCGHTFPADSDDVELLSEEESAEVDPPSLGEDHYCVVCFTELHERL